MFLKRIEAHSPRLLNIVDELKDGFCTIRLSGEFIYSNLAAAEMLGFDDSNLGYNFFTDIIREETHINNIKENLSKNDFLKDYELELYSVGDNKFPVLLTLNLIKDPAKNIIGMSVLIKDMTYIKRVQQQLLQAQKMESIGMLASGVAHEFNNILTGIIPNAELIKLTTTKSESNFLRADSIQKSAYRAAEIVKKLLNFARNDQSKKEGTSTNFVQAATETIDIIRKLFDREIEIETEFDEGLSHVKIDDTAIQQIIMNLSINAKDAINGKGKIIFKADNFTITKENKHSNKRLEEGKYVRFQVSDTGHGIDKDKQKYIFDPFFTTKEPGKGTGLGLSMVYGIVSSAKGEIYVQSESNLGTTFSIYLPSAENIENVKSEEYKAKKIGMNRTILVIDDENMIVDMSKDMLCSIGFNVHTATNGFDGLKLYKKYKMKIDIVLLDLLMPGMSGTTCYEKLKLINPQIKVIVASGIGELSKKKELEKMGINAYLEKPYDLEGITTKLENIL
jgi:two-component system cell cycle sensor histidine kinase/response regulator CckA